MTPAVTSLAMRGRLTAAVATALLLLAPASALASFGPKPGAEGFAVTVKGAGVVTGAPGEVGAGEHPSSLGIAVALSAAGEYSDGDLRGLHLELPPGFLVNPTAVPECMRVQFAKPRSSPYEASASGESCPEESQVGTLTVRSGPGAATVRSFGVFNLVAPYGRPGAFGASPYGVPVVLAPHVREGDAGLTLDLEDLSQAIDFQALELTLWGTPWALEHDGERGNCLNETNPAAQHGEPTVPPPAFQAGTCSIASPSILEESAHSYLTLPTTPCGQPLPFAAELRSWQGGEARAEAAATDGAGHTVTLRLCRTHLTVPKVQLRTDAAAAPSGLVFNLDVNDGGGILNPGGIARPAIKQAIVTLPEGVTINPSLGAGLGVCSEEDFAREELGSAPGAGCPESSKLGTIEVEGMLGLGEPVTGSLFLATPYENRFGSLLALYMVARNQRRGIFVRSVGEVEPDPRTGRLVASFDELPRLLYTHFTLAFREGQRAALASPPACGNYPTDVRLASWADPGAFSDDATSYLPIRTSCPPSPRPFAPALLAGSANPSPGAYTPFDLRISRSDGEAEVTSYSATFPPGLLGKIAGIPFCPDAAIAAAAGRSGAAELAAPSCPDASRVGRTMAGYGLGATLAWAPGGLYLAGPYHGAPLSIVAIDSALVGPFDLGVVVVRSAIRIDPRTAQASIDSSGSDPIPHLLKGIPLHLRDIRVYVDRPGFTLTPTSCDVLQTTSLVTGAGADPFDPADDGSAASSDRYQLLGCGALGFRPRLAFRLRGSTRHGAYPALRATYTPRPGDANLEAVSVTMPHSLFLAQEHIDRVCTRTQFAAGACPSGSVYGSARALTPLLDERLEGPVYLRSSSNAVPDLVADLHGRGIEIELPARIDSRKGGIRASFESLPDAPVTSFTMSLFGGRRGLLANAESPCGATRRASARFLAQDNATAALEPRLRAPCHRRAR